TSPSFDSHMSRLPRFFPFSRPSPGPEQDALHLPAGTRCRFYCGCPLADGKAVVDRPSTIGASLIDRKFRPGITSPANCSAIPAADGTTRSLARRNDIAVITHA